jgi:hypothetical protein
MTEKDTNENVADTSATEAPADTQPAPQAPGAPTGPNLTIGDLRLVARVIQVSSERGAIRANEMATVGDLYNRLVEFLNAVTPKQPEGEKPAEGGEATTEAPAESTQEPADEGSKGE